jgi:hypothetical protein
MRKPRDDSAWSRLTPEQRATLEEWLFDEQQGYADVLERARKEFKIEGTLASLGRYYRRRGRERQLRDLVSAQSVANDINNLPVNTESLRKSAVKLVGKAALMLAAERPPAIQELESLNKVLLASEDNDLRRERLHLAVRAFEYQVMVSAREELPKLAAYMEVIYENPNLSEDDRLGMLIGKLFPKGRVKEDLQPTPEKKAEPGMGARFTQAMDILATKDDAVEEAKLANEAPAEGVF